MNLLGVAICTLSLCLMCLLTSSNAQRNGNRNRNRNRNTNTNTNDAAEDDDFDGIQTLNQFGYLDDVPENQSHSYENVQKAVREFQRFNGLSVTGQLNSQTVAKMRQPRCGLKDVVKPRERPASLRNNNSPTAPLAYHAPGYKWNKNEVTYRVEGFTRQLPQSDQTTAFVNAFRKWSDVTPLRFRRSSSADADIQIKFAARQHGDGAGNSFDGRGKTLAHAFFPGDHPISGDTHFDDQEEWTVRQDRGTNLEIVAAHEFGHALGLGHSSTPTALMAPYYQGYDANYQLHRDDIRGIQVLYGGAVATRAPPTPRPTRGPTQRPTTRRPTSGKCNIRFDAIEQIHDGKILGFKDRTVHTITRNGPTNPQPIRTLFPRAPTRINAVVYDRYARSLYFFKGRRYWKYQGFRKAAGYPKRLPNDFQRIHAAMQWRDGGIYLFRGNNYTRWTEGLQRYPSGYPRRARSYWNGFPRKPDAAFRSYDGYYYIFKYFRYWRYNSRARKSEGYPKDVRTVWLNCGRSNNYASEAGGATGIFSFLTDTINNEDTDN